MKKPVFNFKSIRPAAVMALCTCIAFSAAAPYVPASAVSGSAPESPAETETEAAETEAVTPVSAEAAKPDPSILTLASVYDKESGRSYAEILMRDLIELDSAWYSEIYGLASAAPQSVAPRLNRSEDSLLGRYSPLSASHSESDPSTWIVEQFKNVTISFADSSGVTSSAVSNAQDLVSMVNVYAYYHDMTLDELRQYAKTLWTSSHSYQLSMGDVYFCEGCVDPLAVSSPEEQDTDLAGEDSLGTSTIHTEILAAEPESAAEEITETEGTGASESSDSSYKESGSPESMDSSLNGTETSEVFASSRNQSEAASTFNDSFSGDSNGREVSGEAGSGDKAGSPGTVDFSLNGSEISETSETSSAEESPAVLKSEASKERTLSALEALAATADSVYQETEGPEAVIPAESEENSDHAGNKEQDTAGAASQMSMADSAESQAHSGSEEHVLPGDTAETSISETSGFSENLATVSNAESLSAGENGDSEVLDSASEDGAFICPGHIDLQISAQIHTLQDGNRLFELDSQGTAEEEAVSEWPGWNNVTRSYARRLSREDWTESYGLTILVEGSKAPLSSTEIESYLSLLPSDTSETRKQIIRFALESVGKIPYYWGGKAGTKDYDGNHFGSVTVPDHRGRILKGLDCSGWASWVYWSVTGTRLPYEGTEGLCTLGRRVAREELQPGDLIIVTGETPHVVMFLTWAENGQIQCIHETGSANNVTISTVTADWPYYRNLLD